MGRPLIGYEDFYQLANVVVTDPSEESGFPATRLRDHKSYDLWKPLGTDGPKTHYYTVDLGDGTGGTPGPTGVDYFACINHTLKSSNAQFFIELSTDNFASVVITLGFGTPTFDRSFCFSVQDAALPAWRYWRVRIDNLDATEYANLAIGEIRVGRGVVLPEGVNWRGFDPWNYLPRSREHFSAAGVPIRSVTESIGRDQRCPVQNITRAFLEDNTENTGFRWWHDNVATKGGFSVFSWFPEPLGWTYNTAFNCLWGSVKGGDVDVKAKRPDAQGGLWDLNFTVTGRGELE